MQDGREEQITIRTSASVLDPKEYTGSKAAGMTQSSKCRRLKK